MSTGFLFDERYLNHNPGIGHPECPERLSVSIKYLKTLPLFNKLKQLSPQKADIEWIRTIHSKEYIERVKEYCRQEIPFLDTQDVGISKESFEIALLAAGGALKLADEVMLGSIKNGFALLRPPGHHAENSVAMGFCLFNNIAILAKYLQKKYSIDKVLILDFDVHHGNGTQHAFYEDPSVLYVSTHQYPFYPGTGAYHETGEGKGKNTTLNCPMPRGANDDDYKFAFNNKIIPKIKEFKPDIVLISAGFDAHKEDPLANINLSIECFGWMTEKIKELAEEYAKGKIISLLEGGYNLKVLPLCIEKHISSLMT